ncbi:MAG: hypothetical protein M3280_08490 [Actinomycetota bacterium]|nr:hypothetical protein [Actinomycetota bacterium]
MRRVAASDRGMSMVETMVAMMIFSMVTIGITPLLTASLRGAGLSRSYTVGKNLAVQAMERIRGLPYFESVKGVTSPTRRDVLDLYFPDRGSGYAAGKFVTECTIENESPAQSAPHACPPELQDGSSSLPPAYALIYEVEFVRPTTVPAGDPQGFTVVTPPANYSWATLETESPPSQLLRLSVVASWKNAGQLKTYKLTSLIGERRVSPDAVRGDATVDFTVQAVTSYVASDGRVSTVTARAGSSSSRIEARSVAGADQSVRVGQLTLVEEEFAGQPGSTKLDLSGAASVIHSPPDSFYAPGVTAPAQTASYQASPTSPLTAVAYLAPSATSNVGVQVLEELPRAEGVSGFTGPTSEPTFWVNNQADTSNKANLLLDPLGRVFTVHRDGAQRTTASTKAETTALTPTAGRKVETTATATLGRVDLFPTTFIASERHAVVVIRDFTATVKCTSTASATATVTGSWSAKIKYWVDPDNNPAVGGYTPEQTITGSLTGGTDPFAAIKAANPKVYDVPVDSTDIWLFGTPTQRGYLSDWSSRPEIIWSEDATGRSTGATIDGAIQIVTTPTNPTLPATGLNITIGKLSCGAVDKRGL